MSNFTLKVKITDNMSRREITDEGFLKVPAKVARVGNQKYLAAELGLTDRNPNDIVIVHRPPEEVFKKESLDSYKDKDITIQHPKNFVDAETYKNTSVGHVTAQGVKVDDEWVETTLLVKDKYAIDRINNGLCEVSVGYSVDYKAQDGVWKGEEYELVQTNIKVNHVALVDNARAGKEARIYDNEINKTKVNIMTKVKLDSITVDVNDSDVNAIKNLYNSKEDRISQLEKQLADAKMELEKEKKTKEELEDEMEKEKKKSCDSAINELVNKKSELMKKCHSIDSNFNTDKIHSSAIKREFLKVHDNSIDWTQKSDDYVEGVFDSIKVDDKPKKVNDSFDGESVGRIFDGKVNDSQSSAPKGQNLNGILKSFGNKGAQ